MANDRRAPYDYFMLVCGPVPVAAWARDPQRAVLAAFAADGSSGRSRAGIDLAATLPAWPRSASTATRHDGMRGVTLRQALDHRLRQRRAFHAFALGRIASHPHPRLEAFDRERAVLEQAMAARRSSSGGSP